METKTEEFSVHGLVDGRGAAEMLGLGEKGQRRFSVWLAKRKQARANDVPLTPLLNLLPEPAGRLNGAPVFTVESVEVFGIAAAAFIGAKGYRPSQPKAALAEEVVPLSRTKNTLPHVDDLGEF